MKISKKKFNLAAISFGLLIFTFAIFSSCGFLLYVNVTRHGETAAYQSITTIRTLQGQYASKHQGKFAPNFDELIKSVQLDEKFKGESPVINGYIYKMTVQESSGTQPSFYSVTADPVTNKSDYFETLLHYYIDSSLKTIKTTEENRQANALDPSI